ncbi:MAG: hypothetical protein ACRBFS_08020 [Aureispira sp.]
MSTTTLLVHSIFNASIQPSIPEEQGLYLIEIRVAGEFLQQQQSIFSNWLIYEEIHSCDSLAQAIEECLNIMNETVSQKAQN